jgi:hypothetical protein
MSTSSITFLTFSTSASPSAASGATPRPRSAMPAQPTGWARSDEPKRGHGLRDAMLSALQAMGLTGPAGATPPGAATASAAAPAAATDASVSPATATSDPMEGATAASTTATGGSLQDAVWAFANALSQALRGHTGGGATGSSEPDGQNGVRRGGEGRRHAHHNHEHAAARHGHAGARAYSGLAERLEALSRTLTPGTGKDSSSAVAPAADAAPTTPTASPPGAADPTGTTATPTPAAAASSDAATPEPGGNALVDAFKGLLSALGASPAGAASTQDAASRLGQFLHLLSQALQPSEAAPASLHVGILIDVTA